MSKESIPKTRPLNIEDAQKWGNGDSLEEIDIAALNAIYAMSQAISPEPDTFPEVRQTLLGSIAELSKALQY
jgi:hypothetical protein